MHLWSWLVENFMNGELFFYVIPAVLLVILIIVIFLPDANDRPDLVKEKGKADQKEERPLPREAARHDTVSLGPPPREAARHDTVLLGPPPRLAEPRTYREGLAKTREGFFARLKGLFAASEVTDGFLEEMEAVLYGADLGVATVSSLMDEVRRDRASFPNGDAVREFLKERTRTILKSVEKPFEVGPERPFVILMVGVNGSGKTTTIGKLAAQFASGGKKVIIAAADTFRAAAVEQVAVWGARAGVEIVSDREGADPAAVAYRAVAKASVEGDDIVIVDTAGRLQNRVNLMEELRKVHRVIDKASPGAPHETILVVDANNGQNAVVQAREFGEAVSLTGIAVTKLDGTAKGGALIGIARELALPIYFSGIGEALGDLRPFDADEFTEALFS